MTTDTVANLTLDLIEWLGLRERSDEADAHHRLFREDLSALFEFPRQRKIEPLIAHRFPLTEAKGAQELLGTGGVTSKLCPCLARPPRKGCPARSNLERCRSVRYTVDDAHVWRHPPYDL